MNTDTLPAPEPTVSVLHRGELPEPTRTALDEMVARAASAGPRAGTGAVQVGAAAVPGADGADGAAGPEARPVAHLPVGAPTTPDRGAPLTAPDGGVPLTPFSIADELLQLAARSTSPHSGSPRTGSDDAGLHTMIEERAADLLHEDATLPVQPVVCLSIFSPTPTVPGWCAAGAVPVIVVEGDDLIVVRGDDIIVIHWSRR